MRSDNYVLIAEFGIGTWLPSEHVGNCGGFFAITKLEFQITCCKVHFDAISFDGFKPAWIAVERFQDRHDCGG